MGTNYYVSDQEPCAHCGRPYDELHIGKSSAGWCFSLHEIPERGLTDWPEWRAFLNDRPHIRDEYGRSLTLDELEQVITNRTWTYRVHDAEWYHQNNAEPGPDGTVRHQIGRYCTKHGAGTWDVIPGEFS